MVSQSLNGYWEYRIGKGTYIQQVVPFSTIPVGHSECRRYFDVTMPCKKVFLQFDGITYAAKVLLNGVEIGEMLPYCEYRFDITDAVRSQGNLLEVLLEDISPAFGPTAGWENFSGIIRDVTVLYAAENYIEDVFFHSTLLNDYTDAEITVETRAALPNDAVFEISLSQDGNTVLCYTQKAEEPFQPHVLKNVRLWSPETPQLYELCVRLTENGEEVDRYCCLVGVREFSRDRHRFLLNGKPLFLKGVCKHEMFGDGGHCPTVEQMEQDMRMIKETGCNFVRLVHYPHNKKILDIADRLGLMVSEEPGLWWSDTANPQVSAGSLEVLRRTILRDRNHPSIVFWLSFNECKFTEKFLVDSARICRENDPTRMVSGANCMSNEDTKKFYNICNFDFYTMHPYAPTFERSMVSARYLTDKPLLFTEWGGYYVYNNPKLLSEFIDEMNKLYLANSDEGALAGAFYWCWAEVKDFNRGRPACIDGNLSEGLVDIYRHPTMIYDAFSAAIQKIGKPQQEAEFWYEPLGDAVTGKRPLSNDSNPSAFDALVKDVTAFEGSRPSMRRRALKYGPLLQGVPLLDGVPAVIADGTTVNYTCGYGVEKITVIGLVSAKKGYPLYGEYGETVATLQMHFADGNRKEYVLRNGVDVTTVFTTKESSRINPVAETATRVAEFGYDRNFENYVIHSLELDTDTDVPLTSVSVISADNGYGLLLYGILA